MSLPTRCALPSFPPSKGRCQSGRMSTLGKRVWQQCHRGFESLPVRHSGLSERQTSSAAFVADAPFSSGRDENPAKLRVRTQGRASRARYSYRTAQTGIAGGNPSLSAKPIRSAQQLVAGPQIEPFETFRVARRQGGWEAYRSAISRHFPILPAISHHLPPGERASLG
jgi:hypothetical protein